MKIRVRYSSCSCYECEPEEFEMEVPDEATDAQIQDLAEAETLNQMSQPHVYWYRLPLKPPHRCVPVLQEFRLVKPSDKTVSKIERCECGRWRVLGSHYWIEANLLSRVVQ